MMRLLDALWGDRKGFGEIRAMRDGKVQQMWICWPYNVVDKLRILEEINDLSFAHDMYFGVALRTNESGKAADVEPDIHWLWADVDKKTGATFASLLSRPIPPANIVVDSGHGWHLYWKLAKPMTHLAAQRVMADIAHIVGGDAVGDPARILRLAGTYNRKSEPSVLVRILRMKLDHSWRVGDFPLTPIGESALAYVRDRRKLAGGGGTGSRGTRSEYLFIFALEAVRNGMSDDEIYEEMLELPAGEKLREMKTEKARRRWFNLTVKKARLRT